MRQRIQDYIERHQLLDSKKKQLVAVSGGADSVALLLLLQELGYKIEAVHCNFNLRGEESKRDEQFVIDLCHRRQILLHRVHFDTHAFAELHKISIEMAARQLRYNYFEQIRQLIDAERICVAHHRDDSVETILMNLVRGTGIHGLTGIAPLNGHVARPLLCVTRQEILHYLEMMGEPFVTDSSNLSDQFTRNKIRLRLLPLLRELNPQADEAIASTGALLSEAEKVYDNAMKPAISSCINSGEVALNQLFKQPSPQCFLFEWLRNYHFSPKTIDSIVHNLDAQTGSSWKSATHELVVEGDKLMVFPIEESLPPLVIPETGTYIYHQEYRLRCYITEGNMVSRSPETATLDADKVKFPLLLRPIKNGDRFVPFGMKGSKLVSDFLTDRKIPHPCRRRQLVVCDSSGDIVWLVGLRVSGQYAIEPSTRRTLTLQFA